MVGASSDALDLGIHRGEIKVQLPSMLRLVGFVTEA